MVRDFDPFRRSLPGLHHVAVRGIEFPDAAQIRFGSLIRLTKAGRNARGETYQQEY